MNTRRIAAPLFSLALVAGLTCAGNVSSADATAPLPAKKANKKPKAPKNVIVLIGDGMGYNQIAAASLYEKGRSSKQLAKRAVAGDPVRGKYLDNTDLANVLLQDLWANRSQAMGKRR
ncbi:MAG: hypothetical protein WAV52_09330 [Luteococcus japonicus]